MAAYQSVRAECDIHGSHTWSLWKILASGYVWGYYSTSAIMALNLIEYIETDVCIA